MAQKIIVLDHYYICTILNFFFVLATPIFYSFIFVINYRRL